MPNVNLLPSESSRRKGLGSIIILLLIALIWVAVCFFLYKDIQNEITIAEKEYSMKKDEVASLEKELAGLNEKLRSANVIQPVVSSEKSGVQIARERLEVFPEIFPALNNLSQATPKGAWITKLETKRDICLIEGYAFKAQDISEFLRNTKGIDGVSRARLVETRREIFPNRKIPLHHFQLELVLSGGAG